VKRHWQDGAKACKILVMKALNFWRRWLFMLGVIMAVFGLLYNKLIQ